MNVNTNPRKNLTFLNPSQHTRMRNKDEVISSIRGKSFRIEMDDINSGWKDSIPEYNYGKLRAQMIGERAKLEMQEKLIDNAFMALPNVGKLRTKKSPVWSKDDKEFLRLALEEYGPGNYELLAHLVGSKTPTQVRAYYERNCEITNMELEKKTKFIMMESKTQHATHSKTFAASKNLAKKIQFESIADLDELPTTTCKIKQEPLKNCMDKKLNSQTLDEENIYTGTDCDIMDVMFVKIEIPCISLSDDTDATD